MLMFCQWLYFVNAIFCRRQYFIDAYVLLTPIYSQCQYFVDAYILSTPISCQYFVEAYFFLTLIFCHRQGLVSTYIFEFIANYCAVYISWLLICLCKTCIVCREVVGFTARNQLLVQVGVNIQQLWGSSWVAPFFLGRAGRLVRHLLLYVFDFLYNYKGLFMHDN
jgi:hypothetical protein